MAVSSADSNDTAVGSPAEAGFVGVTLVCLFLALCQGWYTPEVVVSCVDDALLLVQR